MSDENVSLYSGKGVKEAAFNVYNSEPYYLAYRQKYPLTIKVMTFKKSFYDISGQDRGLSKVTKMTSLTLTGANYDQVDVLNSALPDK